MTKSNKRYVIHKAALTHLKRIGMDKCYTCGEEFNIGDKVERQKGGYGSKVRHIECVIRL